MLSNQTAMVAVPGQSEEARTVLFYDSKAPHLVTPQKGWGFNCDLSCPN